MTNSNSQKGLGMPLTITIIGLAFVIAGIAYYAIQKQSKEEAAQLQEREKALMGKEAMEKKENEAMMKKDDAMMAEYTGTVLAGTSAPLLDFAKADYDAAVKSDKLVVLYFYANWCPICKVEFPQAQAAFNELTTDKVIGFRVNYKDSDTDSEEETLARQFGIPYQHTKVFLKNGKQILKAPDSWDKMRYLDEINKAIVQ